MHPIKARLFTPGPVEIPVRVLQAMSVPQPHHRTDGFRKIMQEVTAQLARLHGTQGEVFLLAASGSGAMEAAVANLMAPGEAALAVVGGKFGERWAEILMAFGVPHEVLEVEWGHAVDPARVAARLRARPELRAVFATHSETSTGSLHDAKELARACRELDRVLVLDAITSVGVHPLPQDEWGVDVVVCGSQKGLMAPPGLATLSLAPAARVRIEGERLPRCYFDLRRYRKSAPTGDTPWTPPVSLVLAVREALAMIFEEGLDAVYERHRRVALATRAGAGALGLSLFPREPSHAVTALRAPAGLDASAIIQRLRQAHGVVVAGGQDRLKGQILRIGHMGNYDAADILGLLGALEEALGSLGLRTKPGAAAQAAVAELFPEPARTGRA
jgi:aspartate aminotransferase-like enzyme